MRGQLLQSKEQQELFEFLTHLEKDKVEVVLSRAEKLLMEPPASAGKKSRFAKMFKGHKMEEVPLVKVQ